ncbi:hypothetical protein V3N99_03385 [Dermatophilaceae bacterium Soc4.6]
MKALTWLAPTPQGEATTGGFLGTRVAQVAAAGISAGGAALLAARRLVPHLTTRYPGADR